MDAQTGYGKTPAGVAAMAVRNNKPVIAFTGALAGNLEAISKPGFNAVIPITDRPMTLKQSIKEAGILIENAAKRTMGLLCLIPSPHEQEDVIQQHGQ
jgi:glycerate kinase